jgi:hypothetical protein
MPTIIDSLIVELALDPSKFTQGQREAVDSLRKTEEAAVGSGKKTEEAGARSFEGMNRLGKQALGFFALIAGGVGMKEFAQRIVTGDVEMGRMALRLGQTVSGLSVMRGAAILAGGDAATMTQSALNLTQQLQMLWITGTSQVIPFFRALHIDVRRGNGTFKDATELYLEMAKRFEGMDPARAGAFMSAMGIDNTTIAMILKGRDAFQSYLDEAKKFGPINEEDAAAAETMLRAWRAIEVRSLALGGRLTTTLLPTIRRIKEILEQPISEVPGNLAAWISRKFSPDKSVAAIDKINPFAPIILPEPKKTPGLVDTVTTPFREMFKGATTTPSPSPPIQLPEPEKMPGLWETITAPFRGEPEPTPLPKSRPIPSRASGDWKVPEIMLAMLHPGEMVVPAPIADKVRAGGDGGGLPGRAPEDRETRLHGWEGIALRGVQGLLQGAAGAAQVNNSHTDNRSESSVHNNTETHVGNVHIHTTAQDASGIARDLRAALETSNERIRRTAQANSSLV